MRSLLTLLFASFASVLIISSNASAQGCVAIRSVGAASMNAHPEKEDEAGWTFGTSYRYFKSFRHFSGSVENKARQTNQDEVINHQYSFDLSLIRTFNNRWSALLDVPILDNTRSSLYEHGLVDGKYIARQRHQMHSFGLGDMRFAVYAWLLDPKKARGNIQVGLGLKLPTGDYNVMDYWYNVGPNGTKVLRPVDPSIQLGDGGTGITLEINTFYNFSPSLLFYASGYYLSNPREENNTRTFRETLSPALANEAITSVPDQYMFRGGLSVQIPGVKGLTFSGGAKLEGIPVYDLIGGSADFRRPGYIWSIEPSLNYSTKKVNFFVSVPFAVYRNRTWSVTDRENTKATGKHVQGDAAFANYVINAGFSVPLH